MNGRVKGSERKREKSEGRKVRGEVKLRRKEEGSKVIEKREKNKR